MWEAEDPVKECVRLSSPRTHITMAQGHSMLVVLLTTSEWHR